MDGNAAVRRAGGDRDDGPNLCCGLDSRGAGGHTRSLRGFYIQMFLSSSACAVGDFALAGILEAFSFSCTMGSRPSSSSSESRCFFPTPRTIGNCAIAGRCLYAPGCFGLRLASYSKGVAVVDRRTRRAGLTAGGQIARIRHLGVSHLSFNWAGTSLFSLKTRRSARNVSEFRQRRRRFAIRFVCCAIGWLSPAAGGGGALGATA